MPRLRRVLAPLAALIAVVALGPAAASASAADANVAALQVALKATHDYHGGIDGIRGPLTDAAVRSFQRSHHLTVDGIAGPQTRGALGRRGGPDLGSRVMRRGDRG